MPERPCCAGHEPWRSVLLWPEQAEITEQHATEGLMSLVACPQPHHNICIISGAGTKLTGGALQLESNSVLVFDGCCTGVEVADCELTGAPSTCSQSYSAVCDCIPRLKRLFASTQRC
jgi:hypothetical protein